MGLIQTLQPWTEQPHAAVPAQPDGFRHLTYGPHLGGVDGGVWTPVNAPPIIATSAGLARRYTAGSTQSLTTPARGISATNLTMYALVRRRVGTINEAIVSVGAASGSNRVLMYAPSANQAAIFSGAGGTTGQAQTAIGSWTDISDRWYVMVGRVSGAARRDIWLQAPDVTVLTASSTTSVSPTAPTTVSVGSYYNDGALVAGFYASSDIAAAGVIPYAISDAQVSALLNDLQGWAQWLEPRRILIPIAGAAAAGGNVVDVPAATLTLTGFAPTVTATANQVVDVPLGTLTLAAQTPTVTSGDNQTISVPAGTLTLTANAPTVVATANQLISVPAGTLTLTGQDPTVTASANQAVDVPLGTLTLSGLAPNVLNGNQQVVQVPLGTLTLTGQTPTVAVSAHQVIAVPAGTLTLAAQTPTVVATDPQLISVPLGALTLTGLVPNVSNVGVNNQISVPLGTLTLIGGTPVVRVSTDADAFVDRFATRSRITTSVRFGSRITTQVGLRSSLKD